MNLTKWCLLLASLFDIIPGFIHLLATDGGANSIAGITLQWDNATSITVAEQQWNASTYHEETILVLFAALGLLQIKIGVLVMGASIVLPKGNLLNTLTFTLLAIQIIKIILDVFGYRHIHSVAPVAPGAYKPYVVVVFYVIASISILIESPSLRKKRLLKRLLN